MNHNIQNPLALVFDKEGYLYASSKQGTVFKAKVESDFVSLKGKVIAQITLDCGRNGCTQPRMTMMVESLLLILKTGILRSRLLETGQGGELFLRDEGRCI